MELELHLLEAIGTRKQVFEQKKSRNRRKEERIEVTMQMITNQENRTTSIPTAMPHYVNVDGSKSVESNND